MSTLLFITILSNDESLSYGLAVCVFCVVSVIMKRNNY